MFRSMSRITIGGNSFMDQDNQDQPPGLPKVETEIKPIDPSKPSHPSPADFEAFVPWVCLQWRIRDIVKIKITHDEYPKATKVKGKAKSSKILKATSVVSIEKTSLVSLDHEKTASERFQETLCIPLTAYYDGYTGDLVWISITNYRFKMSTKLIEAINICVPYHPCLAKLTFRNCNLSSSLLLKVSTMLFNSKITELCFDDSFLPEANYNILLDELSQLRHLSLSRCKIDDDTCERIVQKIDYEYPASKSLQLLDLGSNFITDIGAKAIGHMLRNNRRLLHINLSGNKITDEGFASIANALKEFPLSRDEIMEMKRDRMRYLKDKTSVYHRCLNEVLRRKTVSDVLGIGSRKSLAAVSKSRKTLTPVDNRKPEEIADLMATRIVGEFRGTYGPKGLVQRDGYFYAKGNFTLCSLNVAYNNLDYFSVRRICNVLRYQSETLILPPATGLLRVVIEGNDIPTSCPELDSISMYLKQVSRDNTPTTTMSRYAAKKHGSAMKIKARRTP